MYVTPKKVRRRGRLPKQARKEVQSYVQAQFHRYQLQQRRQSFNRIVVGVIIAALVGASAALLYLRVRS